MIILNFENSFFGISEVHEKKHISTKKNYFILSMCQWSINSLHKI